MNFSTVFLTICLMAIPTGSIPIILSLVKECEPKRQRWILIREGLFSMALAFIFLFLGKPFLQIAEIETYAVNIAGGFLLFIIALRMIFPSRSNRTASNSPHKEPFVFPIATPFLAGGGVLTVIIVCAQQASITTMVFAICLAWSLVLLVMASLPFLYKIVGRRGLIIIENLMGMILLMRACDLIQIGISVFIRSLRQ